MIQYIYFLLFSLFEILTVKTCGSVEGFKLNIKIKNQPHIVDLASKKDELALNSKNDFGKNKDIEFQIGFGKINPEFVFNIDCLSIRKNLEIEFWRKNANFENQYEKIETSAVYISDIISNFQFEKDHDTQGLEEIFTCKVTHNNSDKYNPVINCLKKNPEIAIRFVLKLEPSYTQDFKPFILKTSLIRLGENTQGELTLFVIKTEEETLAQHKESLNTTPFEIDDQQRSNTQVQPILETGQHNQAHTTKRPSFTKDSETIQQGRETRSTGSNKPNSQIQKSSWKTIVLFILGGVLIFISILFLYLIISHRKTLEAPVEDTNNKNDNI
ncbi:hypothetical protein CDIK_2493 [Cucumispora dikerogammari]|nr:hypothetical protein CDIK_2493 [Cucumispora dikerogammari]